MKVDGLDANLATVRATKQMKPQKSAPGAEASVVDTAEVPQPKEHGGGAINLLQQGHFKGVADVRLRINFLDKIQALENEQLQESAKTGFQTFDQTINEPVSSLGATPDLTDEQRGAIEQFLENIQGIQDGFLQGDEFSIEDLISKLQGEFDSLVPFFAQPAPKTLESEVLPPTEVTDTEATPFQDPQPLEQEPIEEIPAPELTEEPPALEATEEVPDSEQTEAPTETGLLDIFASLQQTFEQAIADLQMSLSETQGSQVLPPISEPSGNGKAFEKFMAIYQDAIS